jgi:hypothetical protein
MVGGLNMSNTQLENLMDNFVKENLRLRVWIDYWDTQKKEWIREKGALGEHVTYRIGVDVVNEGSETFVKNVQVRIVDQNREVTLYKSWNDSTHTVTGQSDRQDSPIDTRVREPGQNTINHYFYARITKKSFANSNVLFRYGIYAEIIPQGHRWGNYNRTLP